MSNHLADALRIGDPERASRIFATLADGRRYTYGDVDAVSARFACAVSNLGVRPGDRVAVQLEKSVEALMLYLGVVRAGGVFLPLNTAYTASEVEYFVRDAEPALLVVDPSAEQALAPVARDMGATLETMGVWRGPDQAPGSLFDKVPDSAEWQDAARGPGDLGAILYTSGTTGRSKGAMLSHENLASNARVLADHWRFTAEDVLIHALPIYHTHGLFVATNTTLVAGGSLIFLEKFSPDAVLEAMPRATAMMGVPTFYTRLLADDRLTREATAHMRLFISGSAPMLAETHRQWEERTGHRILERYGMSECGMATSNPYDGERRAGTVGHPLPGVELRVTEPATGAELPAGQTGMVELRGPNVFQGYWRMPEKTAQDLRPDGWLITGDLGQIGQDGYVSIVGRSKDLIISGGLNIYPKEVESAIDRIDGVQESAVIGVPHPDFGEGVIAVVVPQQGAALDEQAIMAALRERLAKFKQPKKVVLAASLPRNSMGKVQKAALREAHADSFT